MPQSLPSADSIVASLIEVLKLQGDSSSLRVLENAKAEIEFLDSDNWNSGTDYYALVLNIPLRLFAVIEAERDALEKTLGRKLSSIVRTSDNSVLRTVTISPILKSPEARKALPKASEDDMARIWEPGCLRLFLSHVSNHKIAVSNVKQELLIYRISGFVAHEDIEPTKEWITEIELALNSAHALAALVTPDFSQSKWTDQEVGIAFGKGLLVVPIRLGSDPYGFMGKSQALSGSLNDVGQLASGLVSILLKNSVTASLMHEMLTIALEQAWSFAAAKKISLAISKTRGFTLEQLDRLELACESNRQVTESFGVRERISDYLAQVRPNPQTVDA